MTDLLTEQPQEQTANIWDVNHTLTHGALTNPIGSININNIPEAKRIQPTPPTGAEFRYKSNSEQTANKIPDNSNRGEAPIPQTSTTQEQQDRPLTPRALCIFTPTRNRADLLRRLKDSLDSQTCMNFEWCVVDDGSSDDTLSTLNTWKRESIFPIRIHSQSHLGKHVAHNWAARSTSSPLFLCVDSDDWLAPDSVQTILDLAELHDDGAGMIFPRLQIDKTLHKSNNWIPREVDHILLSDLRTLYRLSCETAIVFRTKALKEHPFPEILNETFISEETAYLQFRDREYFYQYNLMYYYSQYQSNGLTARLFKHWLENPKGTKLLLELRYLHSKQYPLRYRIVEELSAQANLSALEIALGRSPLPVRLSTPLLVVTLPLAVFLYLTRFRQSNADIRRART